MDGISSTVHPDGIRNTVRPRLRAHRPPPGVLDDKQSRPVSEVSWEVLLLRLGIPQTLYLASAWRCRRGRPPTPCPSSAWPCSPRRLSSPSRLLAAEPVQSSRIRCQGRLPCRRRSGPGAEGGSCTPSRTRGGRWPASPAATTGPAFAAALESRPTPVCLPLRSSLLSSPLLASRRRASFRSQNCSQSLTLACVGYRLQKNHEMVRTMTV